MADWLMDDWNGEDIAILSVGDFSNPNWEGKFNRRHPGQVRHIHFGGIEDHQADKLARILPKAIEFLKKNKGKDKIFVHCFAGINRSSAIIIAYLMLVKGKSFVKALSHLQLKHTKADPQREMRQMLKRL
jgi:protein-tyrosine phosphatase